MYVIKAQWFLGGVLPIRSNFLAVYDRQASWASPQAALGGAESQCSLGVFDTSSAQDEHHMLWADTGCLILTVSVKGNTLGTPFSKPQLTHK